MFVMQLACADGVKLVVKMKGQHGICYETACANEVKLVQIRDFYLVQTLNNQSLRPKLFRYVTVILNLLLEIVQSLICTDFSPAPSSGHQSCMEFKAEETVKPTQFPSHMKEVYEVNYECVKNIILTQAIAIVRASVWSPRRIKQMTSQKSYG